MATDVTLTAALRSNLLSLQKTQRDADTVQLRLATGKKVNTALDDTRAFFASKSLLFRASDLSGLLDGMGQSIQVLKAADQGITTLTTLTEQAQSIAEAARDNSSLSGFVRSGDFSVAAQANLTAAGFTAGNSFTLTNSVGGSAVITITAAMTLSQLNSAINAAGNGAITSQIVDSGTLAGGKRLEIRAIAGDLTVSNTTGTPVTTLQAGIGGGTVGSTGVGLTIATGVATTATQNSLDIVTLENQYNAIRVQIDQLIRDTGYRGTNLLNGSSMTTQFNESNTSLTTITGVTFNSAGLGISAANFINNTTTTTSINETTAAFTTLRYQASTFGNTLFTIQAREDFTKNIVNTLKEGSDKLVLADKNEEGANLLALQTAQELGITALSLAAQSSQAVLRLFQ
jgi:flagellin